MSRPYPIRVMAARLTGTSWSAEHIMGFSDQKGPNTTGLFWAQEFAAGYAVACRHHGDRCIVWIDHEDRPAVNYQ